MSHLGVIVIDGVEAGFVFQAEDEDDGVHPCAELKQDGKHEDLQVRKTPLAPGVLDPIRGDADVDAHFTSHQIPEDARKMPIMYCGAIPVPLLSPGQQGNSNFQRFHKEKLIFCIMVKRKKISK